MLREVGELISNLNDEESLIRKIAKEVTGSAVRSFLFFAAEEASIEMLQWNVGKSA